MNYIVDNISKYGITIYVHLLCRDLGIQKWLFRSYTVWREWCVKGAPVSHPASVQAPQVITAWIQVHYIYMVQTWPCGDVSWLLLRFTPRIWCVPSLPLNLALIITCGCFAGHLQTNREKKICTEDDWFNRLSAKCLADFAQSSLSSLSPLVSCAVWFKEANTW